MVYLKGQALTLGAGDRRSDITIRLWKEGAITGRVVDDFGEPVVGILVQAWAERFQAGRAMFESALPVVGRTDDRGVYRMIEVPPGLYVVVIAQPLVTTPANAAGAAAEIGPVIGPGPMNTIGLLTESVHLRARLAPVRLAIGCSGFLRQSDRRRPPTEVTTSAIPRSSTLTRRLPRTRRQSPCRPATTRAAWTSSWRASACTACPVASLDPTVRRQT